MKKQDKKALYGLLGLAGVIIVFIIALLVPSGEIFQGKLPIRDMAGCNTLILASLPDPIKTNEGAVIVIDIKPPEWVGMLRATTSGGSLSDKGGKSGAFIDTTERILGFSGADANTTITVQALGEENEKCISTLKVTEKRVINCNSLSIETYPAPLPANESAEFNIVTSPENWDGSFVIQADSGKLNLSSADANARGQNTNLLVTSIHKIIYNGGKEGEQIHFQALGEESKNCSATVTIGT